MISNLLLQTCIVLGAVTGTSTSYDEFDLEAAMRVYRITVYNKYHTEREQFDQLQELGRAAEDSWKRADNSERAQILRWLENSARSVFEGQPSLVANLASPSTTPPVTPDPVVHDISDAGINDAVTNSVPHDVAESVTDLVGVQPANVEQANVEQADVEPSDAEVDSAEEFSEETAARFTTVLDSVSQALTDAVSGAADDSTANHKEAHVEINITGPTDEANDADSDVSAQESRNQAEATTPKTTDQNDELVELARQLATDSMDVQKLTSIVEKTEEIYWRHALLGVQTQTADAQEIANSKQIDEQLAELLANLESRVVQLGSGEEVKTLLDRVTALIDDQ